MGDRNLRDTGLADWLRRLPHYLYVADLIAGKQVLEIGCGSGEGAKFLADHGAARVVGVDARSARIEHARRRYSAANLSFRHEDPGALEFLDQSFDAVFVPDGAALVKRPAVLRELRRILMPSGVVVVVSPSADRGPDAQGLSFHQLRDVLEPLFHPVRLVAQTPLVAMGLVEYADEDSGQVALDTSLIEWTRAPEGSVTDYMAIGGGQPEAARGFTIVQLPLRPGVDLIGQSLGQSLGGNAIPAAARATGSGPAFAATGPANDAVPSNGTVTAQIAGALQAHADLTRELERALAEQQAYSDELREELEQIRERIDSSEGARQDFATRAEALQEELKSWRNRAALAEGEVMRLKLARGEQPAADEAGELGSLRAELADARQRLERVAVHWKEAEARSEQVLRRVTELEAEVERERQRGAAAVTEARAQFDQELSRAVEQAREQATTEAGRATSEASSELRTRLGSAEQQLGAAEERVRSLTTELDQLRRDRDEQINRAEAAEAARAELEHELHELRAALAARPAEPGASTEAPKRKSRSRKKPATGEASELPLPATLPGFEAEPARATEDVSSAGEDVAPADEPADPETPPHDADA
jgi:SAM-dependent methyltransferase/predicted  nucleic acid-binding Zn-ribbon protein